MAKFLTVLVLCIVGAAIVKAGFNKEEVLKKFMAAAENCQAEVGSAASDLEDMIAKKPAAGTPGKCLRACVMKKFEAMDANGKLDKAVAMKHSEMYCGGDEAKLKVAAEIVEACAGIAVSDDHCEAAEEYGKCFKEQAIAHGVDKMEF